MLGVCLSLFIIISIWNLKDFLHFIILFQFFIHNASHLREENMKCLAEANN